MCSILELGWEDWVVEPKRFVTHYCEGSCLTPDDPSASHDEQFFDSMRYKVRALVL